MIPRAHITAWRASAPLLAPGSPWDVEDVARYVRDELLVCLHGDVWRGESDELEQ